MTRPPAAPRLGLVTLAVVFIALAWFCRPQLACAEPECKPEAGPRLLLPGDEAVSAGRIIDLAWTEADSVAELEILLSSDGGRTYTVCVSPELDPRSRHFHWRIPDLVTSDLRLRIRFNRGGREIEGPPVRARLFRGEPEAPEPLGLPSTSGDARTPRPADGPLTPQRGAAQEPGEGADPLGPHERASSVVSRETPASAIHPAGRSTPAAAPLDRVPRFVPMRT
jgi:hypothetical protein